MTTNFAIFTGALKRGGGARYAPPDPPTPLYPPYPYGQGGTIKKPPLPPSIEGGTTKNTVFIGGAEPALALCYIQPVSYRQPYVKYHVKT